jgi:hypothetical protein
MTMVQAVETAQIILRENRNNGELEGVLNPWRVAALSKLIALAQRKTLPASDDATEKMNPGETS